MRRLWRDNSLSIVVFTVFVVLWVAQALTGLADYNDDRREHREAEVTLGEYLGTGHFLEATAENWVSEFLQMGFFVVLTALLVQKGSAESRKPEGG